MTPDMTLTPASEAELAALVAGASGPLRVLGGGTRIGATGGQPLSTAALSGVTLYEPGALTLVVQAGTPVAKIETLLAEQGQRLAFEPMDHRALLGTRGTPTIGGVFAANVSGPRRIQCGAARDFLLGVRFVDGRGRVIRNGGRVMKNVTGYDLVKLMAGSFGTLGVLSEVALKVLPCPQAMGMLCLTGLSDADAVRAMSRALGSPCDVTGAAHLPGQTLLRLEGRAASVRYRLGRLRDLLAPFGEAAAETDPDRIADTWRAIRDVAPFHDQPGDVWRISVKPSDAPGLVAGLPGAQAIYDWGGGLVWLLLPPGGDDPRQSIARTGGHATLIRGTGQAVFQPLPPPVAALQQALRARFDPRGILNPGLMA